jgi:hypothetical protein
MRFNDFHLPDISGRVPARFFANRGARRSYVQCLANHLDMPTPDLDLDGWYSLTNDQFVRPWGPWARAFGKGVLDHFVAGSDNVTRNYLAVLMDAYPEVDWEPWRLGENSPARWTNVSIFIDGITLPSTEHDSVMEGEPRTISGRQICRSFIRMLASVLQIPENSWETGWNNVTTSQIERCLNAEGRISGWEQFLSTGCPQRKSLFSALSTHFDDVGFTWWPWLVGGNVPIGWGNPSIVGEATAREQLTDFFTWYVRYHFNLDLASNMDVLYRIGQRSIEVFHSVLKNHFRGSPQEMIEFTFPEHLWDPTRFGLRLERQSAFYHSLRGALTPDEIEAMNSQRNQGWEHRFEEFGHYPRITLSDGRTCGGSRFAHGDIWFLEEALFVDVLGEDHFDATLSRCNNRSAEDVASRFEQRQIQDRWRWNQCLNANYKIVAIGPELELDDEGFAIYHRAVEQARAASGPIFIAIGWPEDADEPIFGGD